MAVATKDRPKVKEPWEMTQAEFDTWKKEQGRLKTEEWNRAGSKGFPPSLGIDTVAARTALAEKAGYILPRDANIVIGMKYHKLAVEAAAKAGKPVPEAVLRDYPEMGKADKPKAQAKATSKQDTYYIGEATAGGGVAFKPVKGRKVTVPGYEDYEFFAHGETGVWRVTDAKSGAALTRLADTIKDAIAEAKANLDKAGGRAAFDKLQAEMVKKSGISPRFPAETPKAEPPTKADPTTAKADIAQASKDWLSGRAYIDNAGNYRIKAEGKAKGTIAPWNKAAKKAFASVSDLHAHAHKGRPDTPKVTEGTAQRLIEKVQAKRTSRALSQDEARLAQTVLPASQAARWAKAPNRFDIRGVDTPGRGRIQPGVGYADKGKQRLSRQKHKGFRKIKTV